MQKNILFGGIAAIVLFSSGCTTNQSDPRHTQKASALFSHLDAESAELLRKRTAAFTQAMLLSFQSGDFSHWKNYVMKEGEPGKAPVVDEAKFHEMRKRLEKHWGKFVKCQYLGSLDQSLFRDYIWKCTFESKTDSGNTVRLEELFVVRCTVLKGKAAFAGFGFRFFNRAGFRDQVMKIKKAEVKNEKIN